MIDMHYDLLSVIYQCYLRMDYTYLDNWMKNYRLDNVSKLIANLYFMNEEEMKDELGDNYDEIEVVEMFKTAKEILQRYISLDNVVLSIEGCDYIKDLDELEELYNLGLRNILLVWNNPNKYGSGNRDVYGLTEEGRKFIAKAVSLGICIDVSHMNKQTFYDTLTLLRELKKKGEKVKVIASHSNCYKECPNQRNLDDDQILALKEFDAVIGVVSYSEFVLSSRASDEQLRDAYVKHIEHLKDLVGINHIGVASDDMDFDRVFFGKDYGPQLFDYNSIKEEITEVLKEKFTEKEIEKILYKNINKLFWEEEK